MGTSPSDGHCTLYGETWYVAPTDTGVNTGTSTKGATAAGEKSITGDTNSTIPKQPSSPARVVSFLSGTVGAPCIVATFDDNTGNLTDLVIGTEGSDYSCNGYVLNPNAGPITKTYKVFGSKITAKHYSVLQVYLSSKGYLEKGYNTAKRDTKTRTALKAYQKSIGITATGSLSAATKAKLNMEMSQLFKPVTKAIDNSQTTDQGKAATLPTNPTFPTIPLRIVWAPIGGGICTIWDLNDDTGVGSFIGNGNIMTTSDGIEFCGQVSSVAINPNIGNGSTFIKDFTVSSKDTFANKFLQSVLKAGGYFSGKIDGSFGSATQSALKAFQKKAGVPQTGAVDSATRGKLNSNVKYTIGAVKF
jgi:peptidoglycan hydrolase-like protein with peptidoglycan-binding domain